jgi:hypothetical protein
MWSKYGMNKDSTSQCGRVGSWFHPNPNAHEEYDDTKAWVESMKEEPFYPEHFDPKEIKFEDSKLRFKECFD